jgi:hypothetical protein
MEKGLNDGGFLVCKFIFRVSSDASYNHTLDYFFSSECRGSLPCRRRTREKQMMTTVVMEILLLSPWKMTPSPTSLSTSWLDMCLFCHYLLAPPPLSYHYVNWPGPSFCEARAALSARPKAGASRPSWAGTPLIRSFLHVMLHTCCSFLDLLIHITKANLRVVALEVLSLHNCLFLRSFARSA